MADPGINGTIEKFGFPSGLIAEYAHWLVLLRPKQVTLGALVVAAKGDFTALTELPEAAFTELKQVTADIETALTGAFDHDKINYLMLMMVDPHVHFHVLPRYETNPVFEAITFADSEWPGPPDIAYATEAGEEVLSRVAELLRTQWKV